MDRNRVPSGIGSTLDVVLKLYLKASNKSSINCESGLGSSTLTAVYSGFLIGALFLPTVLIQVDFQIEL